MHWRKIMLIGFYFTLLIFTDNICECTGSDPMTLIWWAHLSLIEQKSSRNRSFCHQGNKVPSQSPFFPSYTRTKKHLSNWIASSGFSFTFRRLMMLYDLRGIKTSHWPTQPLGLPICLFYQAPSFLWPRIMPKLLLFLQDTLRQPMCKVCGIKK